MTFTTFPIPSADITTAIGKFAINFDGNAQHVNHGNYYQPDVPYGNEYAEYLIKPMGTMGANYFDSAGYGGAHVLLFGCSGDVSSGFTLTGNVHNSDTATTTSFTTTETIRGNEWAHVAFIYDGTRIVISINGVPSNIVALTGTRETSSGYEGVMYIGGSDHSNFIGRVAAIRKFTGTLPNETADHYVLNAIRPAVESIAASPAPMEVENEIADATFIADYRTGRTDDLSAGLSGMKHSGYLAEATALIASTQGYNRTAALRPTWVVDPFTWPTAAAAQKTQLASTRIYDDFSRADVHYGNSATLGLGTTRIGAKVWTAASYGINNGNAFPANNSATNALLSDTAANATVIITKPTGTPIAAGTAVYILYGRYVDASNWVGINVAGDDQIYVYQKLAGVTTQLGATMNTGGNWTDARVVVTGSSIEVFIGGVSKGTRTTAVLTCAERGFATTHPVLKVTEFGII